MDHLNFVSERFTFNIISLVLMRVNGYNDQVLRPYNTNINGAVINNINDVLNTYERNIPIAAISSLTSGFIKPSSRVETINGKPLTVSIPNGWGDNRFVFILTVEVNVNGLSSTEVITGYTDIFDTANGSHVNQVFINPDTVFYINNISSVSKQTGRIAESKSILGGGMGIQAYGNTNAFKMTPSQLIKSSQFNFTDLLSDVPNNAYIATDNMVSSYPTMFLRSNSSPVYMFNKILDSYRKTIETNVVSGNGITDTSLIDSVRGKVSDPINSSSYFFHGLNNYLGSYSTTFDYKLLIQMDAFIDNKTFIHDVPHGAMSTNHWLASDLSTQMALVTSSMVINLLTSLSLANIEFSSTNMVPISAGTPVLTTVYNINTLTSLENMPNRHNIEKMLINSAIDAVNDELVPVISSNNELEYSLHVKATLNLDIIIDIAYGSKQMETFVFPAFADSLISPVVTISPNTYRKNSNDVGKVMNIIEENVMNKIDPYKNYNQPVIPMDLVNDVNNMQVMTDYNNQFNNQVNNQQW